MFEILKVKSLFKQYYVKQIEDLLDTLPLVLKDDDFIIIDQKVFDLFNPDLGAIEGHKHLIIEASEEKKSYLGIQPILSELIEQGFKKNHRLVAIGGGITQDITSFCASILYRGVDWVFFPTTLLAQCDSCIGSKTSINFGEYKNQLGNFYPPSEILIWDKFLETLSEQEIRSGLGEMMHFFFIGGEGDFTIINDQYDSVISGKSTLSPLIKRSLEIKRTLAEIDEFDQKERRIFNYGHSFGHAIESMTLFKIQHGIAVSIGMDIANYISMKLGLLDSTVYEKMHSLLIKNRKKEELSLIDPKELINFLRKDKKNVDGSVRVILTKGFQEMFVHSIDDHEKLSILIQDYFKSK